eukprot:5821066-Amphidinium_carterae.1
MLTSSFFPSATTPEAADADHRLHVAQEAPPLQQNPHGVKNVFQLAGTPAASDTSSWLIL